jgi:hypothetical protein
MSQPNLQLLGGSGHGSSHFAFMASAAGGSRHGGLPSSPPRFADAMLGMAPPHATMGDRRMSHPSLPMFNSPPHRPPSSSPESMSVAYQQVNVKFFWCIARIRLGQLVVALVRG